MRLSATAADHRDHEQDSEIDEREGACSVLELIRQIQARSVNPRTLPLEHRRACVEHLTADGFSVPEIAQILQASDRTIARDRAAMRESHYVEASPALTRQMVGHLVHEAEVAVNRYRRFARGTDVAVMEKIEAEKAAWSVTRELLQMLQRLGFLPTAPSLIQGQVLHQQLESVTGAEDLRKEIERVERICLQDPKLADDDQSFKVIKHVKSTARALSSVSGDSRTPGGQ